MIQLVYADTNKPAMVGDVLTDFRGEKALLRGWQEPYNTDNFYRGAKVYVLQADAAWQQQYYPSVFGLKFIVVPEGISAKAWDDAAERSW